MVQAAAEQSASANSPLTAVLHGTSTHCFNYTDPHASRCSNTTQKVCHGFVAKFASADGESWRPVASGLSFAGRKPFYPNVALGHAVLFFGALTVDPANYSDTASVLFSRPLAR